jgi:uncharacterized protein with HEPN domain
MKREIGDYIQDILESMGNAIDFIGEMSYEDFIRDTKTVYAVIRAIEVIGEATKNIPEDIRVKYPEIPWKDMSAMRDKVIHTYFGVNPERVWLTVNEDIPRLKPLIKRVLEELDAE